jgi:hypothetical protein
MAMHNAVADDEKIRIYYQVTYIYNGPEGILDEYSVGGTQLQLATESIS